MCIPDAYYVGLCAFLPMQVYTPLAASDIHIFSYTI